MRRREFITLLGGAAAAWPVATRAQQPPTMPVIGFLSTTIFASQFTHLVAAFRQGLNETGFHEHRNVGIEYRCAEGRYDRLPTLAAELVGQRVAAITATGGILSGLAAKGATSTISIVFVVGDDPVRFGLVGSLNRPGGNITGARFYRPCSQPSGWSCCATCCPRPQVIGLLINPTGTTAAGQLKDLESVARTLGLDMRNVEARNEREIEAGFRLARPTAR